MHKQTDRRWLRPWNFIYFQAGLMNIVRVCCTKLLYMNWICYRQYGFYLPIQLWLQILFRYFNYIAFTYRKLDRFSKISSGNEVSEATTFQKKRNSEFLPKHRVIFESIITNQNLTSSGLIEIEAEFEEELLFRYLIFDWKTSTSSSRSYLHG